MSKSRLPPGWDEKRVKGVITHYESQSEDEAVAEDEAAMGGTVMAVPAELVLASSLPSTRSALSERRLTMRCSGR